VCLFTYCFFLLLEYYAQYHAAVALYTEALEIDALADAVNAVLYCNRAASHMALGKHESAVSEGVRQRKHGYWSSLYELV